jgi:hypothetical protein
VYTPGDVRDGNTEMSVSPVVEVALKAERPGQSHPVMLLARQIAPQLVCRGTLSAGNKKSKRKPNSGASLPGLQSGMIFSTFRTAEVRAF